MKKLIIILVGIGATVGIVMGLSREKRPVDRAEVVTDIAPAAKTSNTADLQPAEIKIPQADARVHAIVAAESPDVPVADMVFAQALETVVSPQSDHEQRKAAWKRLRKSGKLDDAIMELEQRSANDPRSAQNVSALGQAYYKKAGQVEDIREKAILAMKADQTLEAALNLDPTDWEARFTKVAGMSYWPPQLNKGPEVIAGFEQLIQQQESKPAEARFAETYLLLGNYYETLGQPEQAVQIWQRGASQFPSDEDLKAKLAK